MHRQRRFRGSSMAVVRRGTRGMKDLDPAVRSETARAMLDVRYMTTPMFEQKCEYPPCTTIITGYDRRGKRKKYCSKKHTTANCRLRQREQGIRRVMRDGVSRIINDQYADATSSDARQSDRGG
jgi:hypothetical protein